MKKAWHPVASWPRLVWFLDEKINHKLGSHLQRLCDYNEALITGDSYQSFRAEREHRNGKRR